MTGPVRPRSRLEIVLIVTVSVVLTVVLVWGMAFVMQDEEPSERTAPTSYAGAVPSEMPSVAVSGEALWLPDGPQFVPTSTNYVLAWSSGDCGDIYVHRPGYLVARYERGGCDPCVRECVNDASSRLKFVSPTVPNRAQAVDEILEQAIDCMRDCHPMAADGDAAEQ